MSQTLQTAYHHPAAETLHPADLNDRVFQAMFAYLQRDLGLSPAFAARRARMEIERTIPQAVIAKLLAAGIELSGAIVVEVGGGLGGLSLELAHCGAIALCVEPGEAWRTLAAARLRPFATAAILGAVGEALPIAPDSADLVVSLQVLEHVQHPHRVIAEIHRILKPGGIFYFSCENYLAFYEPHYKIAWLPLLPKAIGARYLRLRGRSPRFLNESVTYVTRPGILFSLKRAGFVLLSEQAILTRLKTRRFFRYAPVAMLAILARATVLWRGLFSPGIAEFCVKPDPLHAR